MQMGCHFLQLLPVSALPIPPRICPISVIKERQPASTHARIFSTCPALTTTVLTRICPPSFGRGLGAVPNVETTTTTGSRNDDHEHQSESGFFYSLVESLYSSEKYKKLDHKCKLYTLARHSLIWLSYALFPARIINLCCLAYLASGYTRPTYVPPMEILGKIDPVLHLLQLCAFAIYALVTLGDRNYRITQGMELPKEYKASIDSARDEETRRRMLNFFLIFRR